MQIIEAINYIKELFCLFCRGKNRYTEKSGEYVVSSEAVEKRICDGDE